MTGIINLPNIGTGIGLYAAYKTGKHEPAQYLGYGAAGYLAGFLATGYVGAKEAVYSGYGSYGTTCLPFPKTPEEHDARWLQKIGHEAGCRRGNADYEQCVTSALMRWTPSPVAGRGPAIEGGMMNYPTDMDWGSQPPIKWATSDLFTSLMGCPEVDAPSLQRVAWLRSTRAAPEPPRTPDALVDPFPSARAEEKAAREKLIIAGVVGVSLLLLATR